MSKLLAEKRKAEEKLKKIDEERKKVVLSYIEKTNTLFIDDDTFIGGLLFLKEAFEKKDASSLKRFKELSDPFLVKTLRRKPKTVVAEETNRAEEAIPA